MFVLVRPRRAENVAAACRAVKNMGWRRVHLVGRPPGLDRPGSRALAHGAEDVLDAAVEFSSLADAVAGEHLVVATSGHADGSAWTARQLPAEWARRSPGGRLAVVFGPEPTGLSTRELRACHATVRIPSAEEQPSLNLAMAVLVIAYELRLGGRPARLEAPPPAATAGELEAAVEELGAALADVGYLNPQNPGAVLAELRRLAARAVPTSREVRLLRGVARQVAWAARIASEAKGAP